MEQGARRTNQNKGCDYWQFDMRAAVKFIHYKERNDLWELFKALTVWIVRYEFF